jgi:hypothetical protein
MYRKTALALPLLFFISTAAFAGDFEGIIEVRFQEHGRPQLTTTYFVKPDKLRTDMPAGPMGGVTVIRNHALDRKYVVNHAAKNYMVMSGSRVRREELVQEDFSDAIDTGRKKNILGYECSLLIKKTDIGGTLEAWVTYELKPMEVITWNRKMRAGNLKGLPLLIEERNKLGGRRSRWKVMRLEKKKLSDSLFAPPSGYRKIVIGKKMPPEAKARQVVVTNRFLSGQPVGS